MLCPAKLFEYETTHYQIVDIADSLGVDAQLSERYEVEFSLRNLLTFVIDEAAAVPTAKNDLGGLLRMAAGNDFAGVGATARTTAQFEAWADSQETAPDQFKLPSLPLIDEIKASITKLKF